MCFFFSSYFTIYNLKRKSGFTLIELIIVLLILAILGASVNLLIGDTASTKVYGTARKIQSDIIFAQESAMTHRVHYRVRFTSSGYAVEQCCWVNMIDPSTNTSPFVVTLNSGNYVGVTLDWPTGFTGNYIEFNSVGTPLDGSTYAGCSTAPCAITTIKKAILNTNTCSLSVKPGTGKTSFSCP